jgi:NifU-like domain
MSTAAIDQALETLRPGLHADGFDLRVGSVKPGGDVEVVLEARADACLECLVPDDLMVAMLENAIHDRDPQLGKVTLVKVGFEGLEAH